MAINNWWDGDPTERYWMEITDRPDLGDDLKAPKTNASGGESWSYSLVSYVQPGDIVFHWHKSLIREPALVGRSHAVGPLQSITMSWQAKGMAGRTRGVATTGPAWLLPLEGFTKFDQPISRTDLNRRRNQVITTLNEVAYGAGAPIYGPVQHYAGRELRGSRVT